MPVTNDAASETAKAATAAISSGAASRPSGVCSSICCMTGCWASSWRPMGVSVSPGDTDVIRAPRYATAVGLLIEGASQVQQGKLSRQSGSVKAVLVRMREWFQRNF